MPQQGAQSSLPATPGTPDVARIAFNMACHVNRWRHTGKGDTKTGSPCAEKALVVVVWGGRGGRECVCVCVCVWEEGGGRVEEGGGRREEGEGEGWKDHVSHHRTSTNKVSERTLQFNPRPHGGALGQSRAPSRDPEVTTAPS